MQKRNKQTLTRTQSLDSGLNTSSLSSHSSSYHSSLYSSVILNNTEISDIHICILCLRALMNNAVSGWGKPGLLSNKKRICFMTCLIAIVLYGICYHLFIV